MSQNELFELSDDEVDYLNQMAGLLEDPEVKARWPHTLAGLQDVIAAVLRRDNTDPARAGRQAAKVTIAIARYHGGRQYYLPYNDSLDVAVRDRLFYQRWASGQATPHQLAEEAGVTYQRVMDVLAKQRRLWRKRHEPGLPGF